MNPNYPAAGRPLEDLKRASRLLELIHIIAIAPGRYLRRDLAARFEISERMIQKDLDILRHGLKLPLVHSPDGYSFEKIPRLPALQYSFTEALALLQAVQVAGQIAGIRSSDLAAAIARLEALFPREFTPYLHQIGGRPVTTVQGEHRQEVLLLLNAALFQRHKVRLVYATAARRGEVTERIVHPYHLMPYVRSWQLIAYCERREEVLMFKVDRIRQATILEAGYHLTDDFDLVAYLGQGWGLMRGAPGDPEEIVLRFEPLAGRWVSEEHWHSSQEVTELEDGSVLFRLRICATSEFIHWLLYYGDQIRVEKPEWLRAEVQAAHRRAAEVNERGSQE
jgi:predicted DNA-binding transcriptional regulator YafY